MLSAQAINDIELAALEAKKAQLSKAILEHGGIAHTLKAHIVCATCTEFENFEMDAESTSLEQFATDAKRYFRGKGWRVERGQVLCSDCEAEMLEGKAG